MAQALRNTGDAGVVTIRRAANNVASIWMVVAAVVLSGAAANRSWDLAALIGSYWLLSYSVWLVTIDRGSLHRD